MRKAVTFTFATLVLVLSAFSLQSYLRKPLYHSQSYVFGTLVDISIYGESDERAAQLANHVLQDFQALHQRLHAWKPISNNHPSELAQLNAAFAQGSQPIKISADLANILNSATVLSVKSDGLFNPAIGHLIAAWGFQRDEFSTVDIDTAKIQALVKTKPRMTDIVVSGDMAYSANKAVKLDLGGYAKGYALDSASAYLRQQGVKNALINIGGNIIAIGQHGDQPWHVGIQHPRMPTAIATIDLPDGWAIGTSGDYQRYFVLNDKSYCHIIDPRTGYPAQHTQAVTVLVPPQPHAGVLSDVASKPIFIETSKNRSKVAQTFGIQDFMVIDSQASVFVSNAMSKKLHWVTPNVKAITLP